MSGLRALHRQIVECRACPRLVAWREEVARLKVKRFREWTYWARPLPGFGDPRARLLVVGLAPAAHGGNRTGRMFTGDRSGDFLYAALHRAGFANQPTSVRRDDGLALRGAFITAPCRCAPPGNKPLPDELARCSVWLDREVALLPSVSVVLALGSIGWGAALSHFARRGLAIPRPRPQFGHGAEAKIPGGPVLLGCYHVSQQNTNTGKLTGKMIDAVLARAKELMRRMS
ncbi:MAG: uracil-DNA glycosylase [Deltaproteobacteria bacterium 13_1_20CM_2_69_21]|nr:MAG: uracil-DNA glycosylase [Deltaproteobacteria bacterium 13_1_40CM_4_68_19]OLE62380.1 MAG: uracil-DNA glycosylase [Deltaproteobacteria bacterium 13_1_20CM_2_69_21]